MPTLAAPLDFAKLEAKNIQIHQLTSAPGSPVPGQMYYNTVSNTLFWYDSSIPGFVTARGGGAPSAHATTHQPGGSDPMAVDAAVGTGSLRTLGSGAAQACPGNDARLSDSRAPTGAAGGDLTGSTYPNPVVAALAITDAKVATANKDGAAGTYCMRTLGNGAGKAMAGTTTLDAIPTPVLPVSMAGQRITAVADPTAAQDAATKNYVDGFVQGLDSHASVKAASTGNLSLTGTQTVDGVALVALDRCLVKDQAAPANNGIYVVQSGGWTRALDQDTAAEFPSAYVWVEQGTVNADTGWTCTVDQGFAFGSAAIPWTQFSSAGSAIAGAGLTKTGNTIDAVGTANRITVAADSIDIASTFDGTTAGGLTIVKLGTVNAGTWQATKIDIGFGGTNAATAAAARVNLGVPAWYTATNPTGSTWTILQTAHQIYPSQAIIVQVNVIASGNVILPDISVATSGDVTITFAASQTVGTLRVTMVGLMPGGSGTQP